MGSMAASNPREIVWISFGILAWIQSKWSLWRRVGANENEWATKCCKNTTIYTECVQRTFCEMSHKYQDVSTKRQQKQTGAKKKKRREETRCCDLAIGGNDTGKQTKPLNKNIHKKNWAAGVVLPVGVSPPLNGPRCERCVRVSRFAYECMDLGSKARSLPPKSITFSARHSSTALRVQSQQMNGFVCVRERVRASVCDWLECVSDRAECGRMWRGHHPNTERSVNTKWSGKSNKGRKKRSKKQGRSGWSEKKKNEKQE